MNIQQIANWLQKPHTLDGEAIRELEALVEEYPFFGTARILLARAAKNQEDHRFSRYLKSAALYAGDRSKLFHYLETDAAAMEAEAETLTDSISVPIEQPLEFSTEAEIQEAVEQEPTREEEIPAKPVEEPKEEVIEPEQKAEPVQEAEINEISDEAQEIEASTEESGSEKEEYAPDSGHVSTELPEHLDKKSETDKSEFVLKNLDDWEDIIYEEHSGHVPAANQKLRSSEQEQFEKRTEEIREAEKNIDKLNIIPPDESIDSRGDIEEKALEASAEELISETPNTVQPEIKDAVADYAREESESKETEQRIVFESNKAATQNDTPVWENESFPEEVALSEAVELDAGEAVEQVPAITDTGGKYRFEEWLSALQVLGRIEKKEADERKAAETESTVQPEHEPEMHSEAQELDPKAGAREILEKFLKEEPSISKPHAEFYKPKNMAKQSEQFHEDEWATETLANIYAKQGHHERAIRIYEKLKLQMPDKMAYFASLIEELNKKR